MSKLTLPVGTQIPNHVALIPDGDRRWARTRGLYPTEGHKAGYMVLKEVAKMSRELGIHTFTLWGFSTENWNRSEEETVNIMNLVRRMVHEFVEEAIREGVRFVHLGRKDRLPTDLVKMIVRAEEKSRSNTKNVLNIALDYGGKDEIIRAIRRIVYEKVPEEKINEKLFEKYLDTADQPYPYVDLLIRTSGEQRTSGLLPWQMTYAEYYWEYDHLPDFTPEKFREAILDYSRRRRRFGGNDALEHFTFKPELTAKFELAWWRLGNIPPGMKFKEYAIKHLNEQFGLSKGLAVDAAKLMLEAFMEEKRSKWSAAKGKLKKFYKLMKDELKLAFEPEIVASLEVKMRRELGDRENGEAEATARELYAEVYRISLFQAAKAAHLRVLAEVERNLAQKGFGEEHWAKAEDYLTKYYRALKERIA